MERTWESMQKKTFTNWVNTKLATKNIAPITVIDRELETGEHLIQLLEIIGDESLGRYNKNPKMRIQKVENLNKALEFIRRRGVNLTNIGAEDIVDSNSKLILGLIWTIILRFTIADISEEGLTAKEGLLLWCQRRTAPYVSDFFIKDFTFSWTDGLALCGLIHRHRPDLLDYWSLDKSRKRENTQLAMDVAEKYLGIPKLFGVEDLVDVIKPDERSVMTYVAQYFHAFSALDKVGTAGRRVGQFGQVMQQVWEMEHDYERRVQAMIVNIQRIQATWSQSRFSNYPDAKRQLTEFDLYKNTTKRGWVAEKRDLDTLLSNIQTKLKTYNLHLYSPPQGLTPKDLERHWESLLRTEAERKRSISAYIREIKEVLRTKFAQAANRFQEELNHISLALVALDGDLNTQLQVVQGLIYKLEPLKAELQRIDQLNSECNEANIEVFTHIFCRRYTIYSVDDLVFDLGVLSQTLSKKAAFIENQRVARGMTNVTPQQLEEYTETFRHFDRDNKNVLSKEEFKAALQAEGTSYTDQEFDRTFKEAAKGSSEISFEKFIAFMRSIDEDKTTPEQLKISFRTLANDKAFITENDLHAGGLASNVVDYLKAAMPKTENGFDYNEYLKQVF
ncbi:calponin homology domain-containing protein [Cladochytrium replicatum]|nr:calponin homology domain-containing protein [Cladochytrium replicatum]